LRTTDPVAVLAALSFIRKPELRTNLCAEDCVYRRGWHDPSLVSSGVLIPPTEVFA